MMRAFFILRMKQKKITIDSRGIIILEILFELNERILSKSSRIELSIYKKQLKSEWTRRIRNLTREDQIKGLSGVGVIGYDLGLICDKLFNGLCLILEREGFINIIPEGKHLRSRKQFSITRQGIRLFRKDGKTTTKAKQR